MEDPDVVQVVYTRDELVEESFGFRREERLGHFFEESFEVVFDEGENEENTGYTVSLLLFRVITRKGVEWVPTSQSCSYLLPPLPLADPRY